MRILLLCLGLLGACASKKANDTIGQPDVTGDGGSTADGGGAADGSSYADGGATSSCDNVVCNHPPAKACANASSLRVYDPSGSCAQGICNYTAQTVACANGCANDGCMDDPCVGVTCNMQPHNACADANNLKTYDATGSCSAGNCAYASSLVACAHGCVNDACIDDPCASVVCAQAPAPTCVDANTLKTSPSAGSCAGGQCSYASSLTTCQFGRVSGQCSGDPCAGKVCTEPPASYCAYGSTLRSFADPTARCAL